MRTLIRVLNPSANYEGVEKQLLLALGRIEPVCTL